MTTAKSLTARIEVFRSGTFTPMNGDPITYSAADLSAVADAYDNDSAPAPIVVGHPKTDAPAFGWVKSFDYDASADRLYANLDEIDPSFAEAVKAGRYKKVSLSFFRPESEGNPVPGTWYPRHVGFLGAAAPAVAGLKNVQFADDAEAPIFSADFGERGFEETASLMRSLRDFLIDKFGMEQADKALPSYRIDWLDETTIEPKSQPMFSAKTLERNKEVKDDPNFAARDAELSARAASLKEREDKLAHEAHVSFAEGLVTGSKIPPAAKDKVVAILDALTDEATVSFAAGDEKVSPRQALTDLLTGLPKVVEYGRADLGEDITDRQTVAFASDGRAVDSERMAIHQKAVEFQRKNPGTDYIAAIHAVS